MRGVETEVGLAIATLVAPLVLVAIVVVVVIRRRPGEALGPAAWNVVSLATGTALGVLAAEASFSLTVAAPIVLAAAGVAIGLWRLRRRRATGLALAGFGVAPAAVGIGNLLGLAGAAAVAIGVALAAIGDPAPDLPDAKAPPGRPGSRVLGNVSAAILGGSRVGPISLPFLAALITFIAVWLLVPLLLPTDVPRLARSLAAVVVSTVLCTEAYIRSFPGDSRRAFEAFSWLGEWELGRAGGLGAVPRSRSAAQRWLASHADGPEDAWLRVEVLLLADRVDEAANVAERMPSDTPFRRWEREAARQLVDWTRGGPGNDTELRAAVNALPEASDDRLRAEVGLAVVEVRRRMADGRASLGDAADPLLAVRERLGRRADGQLGRALRRRLWVAFGASGLVVALAFELVSAFDIALP